MSEACTPAELESKLTTASIVFWTAPTVPVARMWNVVGGRSVKAALGLLA